MYALLQSVLNVVILKANSFYHAGLFPQSQIFTKFAILIKLFVLIMNIILIAHSCTLLNDLS